MSDERFERDLRSLLARMAPADVPSAVRNAVLAVPYRQARTARWLAGGRMLASGLVAGAVIVALALAVALLRSPAGPSVAGPKPASPLIESLVEQTDTFYGYRMLRPSNWTPRPAPASLPDLTGRLYLAPGFVNVANGTSLGVADLRTEVRSQGPNSTIVQWRLFQEHPDLGGWTAAIEQSWRSDGMAGTVVRSLPNARIYSVVAQGALASGQPEPVQLVAYAIVGGDPFVISLTAAGPGLTLEELERQGLVADFAVMVASIGPAPPGAADSPALPAQE